MNYNIMILSVGRRVELVNCFHNAINRLKKDYPDFDSKIVAADLSDKAPAGFFADIYETIPRIGAPGYLERIIELCNTYDVKLIVPTIDTELLLLAENKTMIESSTAAKVLVSDLPVIQICRDKTKTCAFLEEHGFLVPKQITKEMIAGKEYSLPLFIKPLNGSSSINAFKVNTEKELDFFMEYIDQPILQEFMEGKEYSIDAFLDFESNLITAVARERLAVRSGEIAKGLVVKDEEVLASVKSLLAVLKPIGHITVQCMKTTDGIKYIEINPRFGGGAPMSIMSGADSCENLFRLLMGQKLQYNEDYCEGDLYLRFDQSICIGADGQLKKTTL